MIGTNDEQPRLKCCMIVCGGGGLEWSVSVCWSVVREERHVMHYMSTLTATSLISYSMK